MEVSQLANECSLSLRDEYLTSHEERIKRDWRTYLSMNTIVDYCLPTVSENVLSSPTITIAITTIIAARFSVWSSSGVIY
jgi:hypothetical protein